MSLFHQEIYFFPIHKLNRRKMQSLVAKLSDFLQRAYPYDARADKKTCGDTKFLHDGGSPQIIFKPVIRTNANIRLVDVPFKNPVTRFGMRNKRMLPRKRIQQIPETILLVPENMVYVQKLNTWSIKRLIKRMAIQKR
jgi:hypothetical protein